MSSDQAFMCATQSHPYFQNVFSVIVVQYICFFALYITLNSEFIKSSGLIFKQYQRKLYNAIQATDGRTGQYRKEYNAYRQQTAERDSPENCTMHTGNRRLNWTVHQMNHNLNSLCHYDYKCITELIKILKDLLSPFNK